MMCRPTLSSSFVCVAVCLLSWFRHGACLHTMLNPDKGAGMTAELDIARESTTLYLRSHISNVWFGIAFNEGLHSAETMAVIFNANGDRQLHDVRLSADYSEPTLLPSQWTLVHSMQYGNLTSLIATRPNVVLSSSDASYANFSECYVLDRIPAMWASGTSEAFADHGPLNYDTTALTRDGIETTFEPTTAMPTTPFPTTAAPSSAPTTAMPTSSAPSTALPTTWSPTTSLPTTQSPTTTFPTTAPTLRPSTALPTFITLFPTTRPPSTSTTDSIEDTDDINDEGPQLTTTAENAASTTDSVEDDQIDNTKDEGEGEDEGDDEGDGEEEDEEEEETDATTMPTSTAPQMTVDSFVPYATTTAPPSIVWDTLTSSTSTTSSSAAPAPTNIACNCDGGVTYLQLRYLHPNTADMIIVYGYYAAGEKRNICTFRDVEPQQDIVCAMSDSAYATQFGGVFPLQTYVYVEFDQGSAYSASAETASASTCKALLDTSCTRDIVGVLDHGCGDLMVIAWKDVDDAVCDEERSTHVIGGVQVAEVQTVNFVHAGTESNRVLIHGLAITFGILSIVAVVCMVKCLKNIDKAYPRVAMGAVPTHAEAAAAAEAADDEAQQFAMQTNGMYALKGRKRTGTNTAQVCETDSESETEMDDQDGYEETRVDDNDEDEQEGYDDEDFTYQVGPTFHIEMPEFILR